MLYFFNLYHGCCRDCGLACVSMVLGSLGIRKRYQTLCALCRTTSIWSVDLAHVLALCGAKVTLSTIYPGANPSYGDGKIPYYESFTRDYKRVETLFQTAHQVGITICHSSITIEQLQIILCSGKYLIIALIDSRKLIAPSVNSSNHVLYSGHYVVLHGWDGVEQCFQVKDPSLGPQSRCMSVQQFEAARKAYGTDEDLIFVEISAAPQ